MFTIREYVFRSKSSVLRMGRRFNNQIISWNCFLTGPMDSDNTSDENCSAVRYSISMFVTYLHPSTSTHRRRRDGAQRLSPRNITVVENRQQPSLIIRPFILCSQFDITNGLILQTIVFRLYFGTFFCNPRPRSDTSLRIFFIR